MGPRSVPPSTSVPVRRSRAGLALLAAVVALGATAPSVSATVFTGERAASSLSGTAPGRSITSVSVSYDDVAGTLTGVVTLAGPPDAGDAALLSVHHCTPSGSACGAPQALIQTALGSATADAGESATGAQFAATRSTDGNRITLTATAPQLVGLPYRSVGALVRVDGTPVSQTDGWGPLSAVAAPPPPPPAPVPPTPAPAPAPAPPVVKAPKLAVSVTGVPRTVKRGRWYTAKVRVRNVGTKQAPKVRLSAAKLSGVTLRSRTASWKTIKTGKSVTARVRVRLTGSRTKRTVKVAVTGAAKLRATGTIVLQRKVAARKPSKPAAGGPLAGRYFWGFVSHVDRAWDTRGVWFTDDRWAYVGLPEGGLPRCTGPKPKRNAKGEPTGEGCVAYAVNAKTGVVTVGALKGTLKGGTLVLDDVRMTELQIPKAGARYGVNLIHRGFNGFCGYATGCTTFSENLALNQDGTFARSSSAISSSGGSGTGVPYVNVSRFPPDQHGRYAVLSGGRVRFSYANGKVVVQTIGIDRKDGRPDPQKGGIVLNGTNFYPDSD